MQKTQLSNETEEGQVTMDLLRRGALPASRSLGLSLGASLGVSLSLSDSLSLSPSFFSTGM